jgi:hypothetical protein
MDQRLWDYIDGMCSLAEKTAVEALLREQADWQARYRELLELQNWLKTAETETPSLRFTKNVMEQIAAQPVTRAAGSYINRRVIYGIAFFFFTVIMAFLIYGFSQVNWSGSADSNPLAQKITELDWGRFFNSQVVNIFLGINIILCLYLLDAWLRQRLTSSRRARS